MSHPNNSAVFSVRGQVALITGATGNLGVACSEAFLEAGARLALIDRSRARLQQQFGQLESSGHALIGDVDLSEPPSVEAAVAEIKNRFGHLDVLVNTVGAFRGGEPVDREPLETWDFLFQVNLRTALLASRTVIPLMREQHSGSIIHVGSRHALSGPARFAAYGAAKSAVVRLTESLARELQESGIRVNCVVPGTMDTPQNRQNMPDADPSKWVSPNQVATVILFLAAPASRAMSGAVLPIYGQDL